MGPPHCPVILLCSEVSSLFILWGAFSFVPKPLILCLLIVSNIVCYVCVIKYNRSLLSPCFIIWTGKEYAYSAGDPNSIPGSGDPLRREWQPTPVFLPGECHGQMSLMGYSPWGHKVSDMTEQLIHHLLHFVTKSPNVVELDSLFRMSAGWHQGFGQGCGTHQRLRKYSVLAGCWLDSFSWSCRMVVPIYYCQPGTTLSS